MPVLPAYRGFRAAFPGVRRDQFVAFRMFLTILARGRRQPRPGGILQANRPLPQGNGENSAAPHRGGPLLAVVDLGTNNCRLLIARPAGPDGFKVVDSFSRIVRLGEGVAATGRLSDAAIDRTIGALAVCAQRIA